MGFRANYDKISQAVVAHVSSSVLGGAARIQGVEEAEKNAVVEAKRIVGMYASAIIGPKGQHSVQLKNGAIPFSYDAPTGHAEIYIPKGWLTRKSLAPHRYFGRNQIHNIINLIATGYSTKVIKHPKTGKTTHARVKGVWRGERISSLAVRPPYHRVNYSASGTYRAAGDTTSPGVNKFYAGYIANYTLDRMLTAIQADIHSRKLNATIRLSDEFVLAAGEERVRTSLYNP